MDLAAVAGLRKSIGRHVQVRAGSQGWTDAQQILSLVLLNVAGGDSVDDLRKLEKDEGFCRVRMRTDLALAAPTRTTGGRTALAEGEEAGGALAVCGVPVSGGIPRP